MMCGTLAFNRNREWSFIFSGANIFGGKIKKWIQKYEQQCVGLGQAGCRHNY